MEVVAMGMAGIGVLITVVTGIWLIVIAFSTSIVWGLCYMFVPFANLVFLFMHWSKTWKPFVLSLLGGGMIVGGICMSPDLQKILADSKEQEQVSAPAPGSAPGAVPSSSPQ